MATLRVTVEVQVSEENGRYLNHSDREFLAGVVYKAVNNLKTRIDPTGDSSMVKFVGRPKVEDVR